MSATLINTEILPFKAEAFVNGDFKTVSSDDLKGKWNIMFFYPADFTFVCPTELGDLAEYYSQLKDMELAPPRFSVFRWPQKGLRLEYGVTALAGLRRWRKTARSGTGLRSSRSYCRV